MRRRVFVREVERPIAALRRAAKASTLWAAADMLDLSPHFTRCLLKRAHLDVPKGPVMRPSFDARERARVLRAYEIGVAETLEAAGRFLGCGREWARICFLSLGLPPPKTKRRPGPHPVKCSRETLRRASRARSLQEAATILRCKKERAQVTLETAGLPVPKWHSVRETVPPSAFESVVRDFQAKRIDMYGVAKRLGCAYTTALGIFNREGLRVPKPRRSRRPKRGAS